HVFDNRAFKGRGHVLARGAFMTTTQKCEHPGCNCQPAVGKKHCSNTCADTKKSSETPCQCKHPECSDVGLKM
ncbi:MAG: hypothetical protein ABR987_21885, partial [Terracidiphilus sp.]